MRTTILFSLLLLLATPQIVLTQTYVSGEVGSQTWTPAGNPYIVIGDLSIGEGDTLTMMAGTNVEFEYEWDLYVYGALFILGSETDSVSISRQSIVSNNEINILSSAGQSMMIHSMVDLAIILGPTPTIIDSSCLGQYINADGSSGNMLTNSLVNGTIFGGTNWTITGNDISIDLYLETEIFGPFAVAVRWAQGIFTDNIISVSATNPWGEAYAEAFTGCSGEFFNNTVFASASYGTSGHSFGFYECAGAIHHNCIQAWTAGIYQCDAQNHNNTIMNGGYGVRSYSPINPVKNNIVIGCNYGFYGPFEAQYSCVYNCATPFANGATPGAGVILVDPQLINTWYLSSTSPCIDAGDPTSPLDPDSTIADMGAIYFPHEVGIAEPPAHFIQKAFFIAGNHPNPFNPQTVLSYQLPEAGHVNLIVYDLSGRLVADLVNGQRDAGVHQVTWDASGMPSGLYFCRIQAGGFTDVAKLMLLK